MPSMLQEVVKKKHWEEAIRLCRYAKMKDMWACLAAMSVAGQDLNTAELAYAAIEEAQKVEHICYIRDITNEDVRMSELAMLRRQPKEAERILLGSGQIYRAIMLWVNIREWERALDLATKHKIHIDIVLYLRRQELGDGKERLKKFKELQGTKLDEEEILRKIKYEEGVKEDLKGR